MSSVALRNLKKIRQSTKDAVTGYIRTDESFKDQEIPDEIVLICIIFYGSGSDEFDPKWKGNLMALSNENETVEFKRGGWCQSIFCKRVINSDYHEWKFKIVKTTDYDCAIGLWRCSKDNKSPPISTFFTHGKDQGYGYRYDGTKSNCADGCYGEPFGVSIEEGDEVTMIADFKELSLCWSVKGESHGKSHDITKDEYRAAIYMFGEQIVEIVD